MQEVSFLQHCRGGGFFEFRGNIGSNLPAVETAILDENLICSRAGDNDSSEVKSRDIAFQTLRIAFRAAVLAGPQVVAASHAKAGKPSASPAN